jgi:DNA mismatch repair ATPase MutS
MNAPHERQIKYIKRQYPDTILLFNLGESFRAYGEDARIAWTTTPAKTHADVFSIAAHEAESLVEELVAMGHRVAICESTGR